MLYSWFYLAIRCFVTLSVLYFNFMPLSKSKLQMGIIKGCTIKNVTRLLTWKISSFYQLVKIYLRNIIEWILLLAGGAGSTGEIISFQLIFWILALSRHLYILILLVNLVLPSSILSVQCL